MENLKLKTGYFGFTRIKKKFDDRPKYRRIVSKSIPIFTGLNAKSKKFIPTHTFILLWRNNRWEVAEAEESGDEINPLSKYLNGKYDLRFKKYVYHDDSLDKATVHLCEKTHFKYDKVGLFKQAWQELREWAVGSENWSIKDMKRMDQCGRYAAYILWYIYNEPRFVHYGAWTPKELWDCDLLEEIAI